MPISRVSATIAPRLIRHAEGRIRLARAIPTLHLPRLYQWTPFTFWRIEDSVAALLAGAIIPKGIISALRPLPLFAVYRHGRAAGSRIPRLGSCSPEAPSRESRRGIRCREESLDATGRRGQSRGKPRCPCDSKSAARYQSGRVHTGMHCRPCPPSEW